MIISAKQKLFQITKKSAFLSLTLGLAGSYLAFLAVHAGGLIMLLFFLISPGGVFAEPLSVLFFVFNFFYYALLLLLNDFRLSVFKKLPSSPA